MSDEIKASLKVELDNASFGKIKSDIQGLGKSLKPIRINLDTQRASNQIRNLKRELAQLQTAATKPMKLGAMPTTATAKLPKQNVMAQKAVPAVVPKNFTPLDMRKVEADHKKVTSLQKQSSKLMYDVNKTGNDKLAKSAKQLDTEIKNTTKSIGQLDKASTGNLENRLNETKNKTVELNRVQNDMAKAQRENARRDKQMLAEQQRAQKAAQPNWNQVGSGMSAAGGGLMKMSAPMLAVSALGAKAAISFESSFAGVRKTVDTTEERFQELQVNIRNMAKEMPTSASEIAKVMEVAGQLGIETQSLEGFTKTMVMMGDATNMSADDAGMSLARFANIVQMSQSDFDKLGSTVVHLGNNLAATESEIVDMGLNIAGAGKQVGMSEHQIMAFAGASASVGLKAEKAGTAISKMLINMAVAAEEGGDSLEGFAKVAGMSGEQFKQAFEDDAAGALATFLKGLGNAEEQGTSTIAMLDELGIKEVRLRDTMLRLAGAGDLLEDSLNLGAQAWQDNSALAEEAAKRYETVESQLLILKNRLVDVGMDLGVALLPSIIEVVEGVARIAESFANLDPSIQAAISKFALFTFGLGAFLKFGGGLVSNLTTIGTGLASFGKKLGVGGVAKSAAAGTGAVKTFGATVGGLVASINPAVAAAVALAGVIGYSYYKSVKEANAEQERMNELVKEFPENFKKYKEEMEFTEDNLERFKQLQNMIGENGDMTAMNTKQQAEYNALVKELAEIYPDLKVETNADGSMYVAEIEDLERLMELKREKMRLDALEVSKETDNRFDNAKDLMDDHKKEINSKKEYVKTLKALLDDEQRLKAAVATANRGKSEDEKISVDEYRKNIEDKIEGIEMDVKLDNSSLKADLELAISEAKEAVESDMIIAFTNTNLDMDHMGNFRNVLDDRLGGAKTSEDVENVRKMKDEMEKVIFDIGKAMDNNDFRGFSDFTAQLRNIGFEAHEAEKAVGEIFIQEHYGEEGKGALSLLQHAMQDFNANGKLNPDVAASFEEFFGISADGFEGMNLEFIQALNDQHEFAARYLATQADLTTAARDNFTKLTETDLSLGNIEIADGENFMQSLNGMTEAVNKSYSEANDSIEKHAKDRIEILDWMKEEELISAEDRDVLVAAVEDQAQKQREAIETGQQETIATYERAKDKIGQLIESIGGEVDSISQAWDGLEADEKEFIAKAIGLDDVNDFTEEALIKWAQTDPAVKEFMAEVMGVEDVDGAIEALTNWNSLTPQEKNAIADATGIEALEDGILTLEEWNGLSEDEKELLVSETGLNVIKDGVITLEEWNSLSDLEKELIVTVSGKESAEELQSAIEGTESKSVTLNNTTSGKEDAEELKGAIDSTESKYTTLNNTTVGTFQAQELKGTIDNTNSKGVELSATTSGTNFIERLKSLWDSITSKKVTITTSVVGAGVDKLLGVFRWTGDDNFQGGLSWVKFCPVI